MVSRSQVKTWATAISKHSSNGRKIFFRFAKDFHPAFEVSSQPVRIILVWKYYSDTGQPLEQEHRWMNDLEDAVEKVLNDGLLSTLALVSTGENLREWTYYANSEDYFMDCLDRALHEMPVFPIEIHVADDAEWEMYRRFMNGLKLT